MKALLLKNAGPDWTLDLEEVPSPLPGPGEVRLRVRASSLNPVDAKFARSGSGLTFPHVLGADAAGEIDALGEGVIDWNLGDRVMALTDVFRWGGFAEQVIVDARVISRLPRDLPLEQAAPLPCAALTAWQAVHQKLNLQGGQTVLITAAGGGVGRYAVQMARRAGARVIGTASRHQDELKALGVEAVIDYRPGDVVEQVLALTDGRGVEAVIDLVSSESATAMTHLLRHNGAIASVVGRPIAGGLPPWGRAISWHDLAVGFAYRHGDGDNLRDLARTGETVAGWVAAGSLDPQIKQIIHLSDVPAALRDAESGHSPGKVVVRI